MPEMNIPIECRGRDKKHKPVLAQPVAVTVEVSHWKNEIFLNVKCPHNTGGHSQRCKASYPAGVDKVEMGVLCPYAVDIPYAFDGGELNR